MTRDLIKYVRDELQTLADAEGDKPLARRLKLPFGVMRSMLQGRDPLASNLFKIAEALDLETYVGPPRSSLPDPVQTTVEELGPSEMRGFEMTMLSEGFVRLEVQVPEGSAKLLLTPEGAKALASELTYQVVHAEKSRG